MKSPLARNWMRYGFYQYYAIVEPERNPFFNFAFAAMGRGQQAQSIWGTVPYEPVPGKRGHLVSGQVLSVENRFFHHWNTDPWELDYGGDGRSLGNGTVFLLPYYMGLYHGFIDEAP